MNIPRAYLEPAPIIGIVHWGRSGTLLLHSLLDSHPDVLSCIPYFWLYSSTLDEFLTSHSHPTQDSLLTFVCEAFPYLFEHWPTFYPEMFRGPNCDLLFGCNREAFIAAFREYLACFPEQTPFAHLPDGHSIHSFVLQAISVAYAIAQRQPLASSRPIVLWQTHFWQADYFRKRFPHIRILCAVRNPLKSYDSWQMRTFEDERVPPFWFYHRIKFRQMMEFLRVPEDLANRCRAVRFEDIHNRTESTMRVLAQWLGIRWHPCLLDSTFDNEPYWGLKGGCLQRLSVGVIPPRNTLVSGTRRFDESEVTVKYLGLIDRLRILAFCRVAFEAWGYRLRIRDRACLALFSSVRYWLFALPSRLDLRCSLEDYKFASRPPSRMSFACRLRFAFAAIVHLINEMHFFRRELRQVETSQSGWPVIEPLLPSGSDLMCEPHDLSNVSPRLKSTAA